MPTMPRNTFIKNWGKKQSKHCIQYIMIHIQVSKTKFLSQKTLRYNVGAVLLNPVCWSHDFRVEARNSGFKTHLIRAKFKVHVINITAVAPHLWCNENSLCVFCWIVAFWLVLFHVWAQYIEIVIKSLCHFNE
jgi:hypothetical protein